MSIERNEKKKVKQNLKKIAYPFVIWFGEKMYLEKNFCKNVI